MVKGWSRDGQGMVKGIGSKGERLLQHFQRAVELQGLTDRYGALITDAVLVEETARSGRADQPPVSARFLANP
eukprot:4734041-Prymnesium_polylepis.1